MSGNGWLITRSDTSDAVAAIVLSHTLASSSARRHALRIPAVEVSRRRVEIEDDRVDFALRDTAVCASRQELSPPWRARRETNCEASSGLTWLTGLDAFRRASTKLESHGHRP